MQKTVVVIGNTEWFHVALRIPLFKAFVAKGLRVILFLQEDSHHTKSMLKEHGIDYEMVIYKPTNMHPLANIAYCKLLYQRLKKIKPDMIYCYNIKAVIYGSIIGRFVGIRKIFSMITGMGYIYTGDGLRRRVLRLVASCLYKMGINNNEAVFLLNSDDIHFFIHQLGLKPSKAIRLYGSGVDVDYYKPLPAKHPGLIRFLLIARLLREKGIMEYFEAAKMVKLRYPEAQFQLIGPFHSNPAVLPQKYVEAWQRAGVIEYLGEQEDVRPFIANASVFVLPSYREGTPRSVLEAMSMGKPIITTTAPGCKETVLEGRNGILVPIGDAQALRDAMFYFIENPEQIQQMGQESRAIAEEFYDVRKVNHTIMQAMGI